MLPRVKHKVTRSGPFLNLLGTFGKSPRPDEWLFILGCYNSGTTLLSKVLASHPSVGGLPAEGIALTNLLPFPERFGWPRMWIKCEEQMAEHTRGLGVAQADRIKRQWGFWYPRGRSILVEKSISDVTRIPFLIEHFSPARFIVMIRNGYAVSEGIRRRAQPGKWGNQQFPDRYPIGLCAQQWTRTYEVIDKYRGDMKEVIDIKYEDLSRAPGRVLASVTDFLGIPMFDPAVMERAWDFQELTEPIRDLNALHIDSLSLEDVEEIRRQGGALLETMGYSLPVKRGG